MGIKTFAKIFCKPLAIITFILVIADIILLNYQYFNLLEKCKYGNDLLDSFHIIILFFYLYWCTSEFTNEYFVSLAVSFFMMLDQKLMTLAIDRVSLTEKESDTPWTQHFFFFSVFATPIFLKAIIHNDFTIIQLILIGILLLILSSLSIFSLYTTLIPQSLVICALVSKFIHIDSNKSKHFVKKILLVAFYALLFLIICECAYPEFKGWIDDLHDNNFCNTIIKYLTGFEFSSFPLKAVNYSKDLNFFDRIGDFFRSEDEFIKFIFIVYILSFIFFKKTKQYYENCFVLFSILALFVPNYTDPKNNNFEINFFIFKTYISIAFAISLSRMNFKKKAFLLIVIALIYIIINFENFYNDLIEFIKYYT